MTLNSKDLRSVLIQLLAPSVYLAPKRIGWCHDIGREHAANKPLLKTVFEVMMRLFSPRKMRLLFVIRDKTKTPLEHLEPVLREDIQKIWDSVSKPWAHKDTPLSEFFNVGSEMIHLMELPIPDPLTGRPEHGGRDRHARI